MSRMDKYIDEEYEKETPQEEEVVLSRVSKNQVMYDDVYFNRTKVDIDSVIDSVGVIEDAEKPETPIEKEIYEEKSYSVNEYLEKAHENNSPDNLKRDIDDTAFREGEDEIRKLIASIDEKEMSEDFFKDLKGDNEDTLIDGINIRYNSEISSLRNIPNLEVYRPCDVNEMIGVFKILTSKKNGPSCVIINKNITSIYDNSSITDVNKGAYIIQKEEKNISAIIVSSGKDINLTLEISNILKEKGYDIRVISMPCIELYLKNTDNYKESLIPLGTKVFVLEESSSYGLYQFVYNDKYLITPDMIEWYQDNIDEFKEKVIEKIENLLN